MKECALAKEIEESLVPKTVSDSEANSSQRKAAVMTPAVPQVASANAVTSSSIAEGVDFSRRKFATVHPEQLFTMPRSRLPQEIEESLVPKTVSDSEGSSSQCKAAVMVPLTPVVSQVASDNAVTTMKVGPQYQSISQSRLATEHLTQPCTLPRSRLIAPQSPGTAHLPKRRQVLKSAAKHQHLKASGKARGRPFFDCSLSSPAVSSVPTCQLQQTLPVLKPQPADIYERANLHLQIHQLKRRFSDVKGAIRAATTNKGVTTLDLVDKLQATFAPLNPVPNDVVTVFERLAFDLDYLHPDLYDYIIEEFGLNINRHGLLGTYVKHLNDFLENTQLIEFGKMSKPLKFPKHNPNVLVLEITLERKDVKLKSIENLRIGLVKECNVEQYAVIIASINTTADFVVNVLVPKTVRLPHFDKGFRSKHRIIYILNSCTHIKLDNNTATQFPSAICSNLTFKPPLTGILPPLLTPTFFQHLPCSMAEPPQSTISGSLQTGSTAEPPQVLSGSTQTGSSAEPPHLPLSGSSQTWFIPQLQRGPLEIASSAEPLKSLSGSIHVAAEQSLGQVTPTKSSGSVSIKSWSTAELPHSPISVSGPSSTVESHELQPSLSGPHQTLSNAGSPPIGPLRILSDNAESPQTPLTVSGPSEMWTNAEPPLTSSEPLHILFTVGPPQLELEPLKLPSTAEPHESSTVSTQTLSSVEPPQSPLTLSTQTWSPPQLQLTGSGPLQIASSAEPPDVATEQSLSHMTPTESSSSLSVKSWSTAELTHLQITVSGPSSTVESHQLQPSLSGPHQTLSNVGSPQIGPLRILSDAGPPQTEPLRTLFNAESPQTPLTVSGPSEMWTNAEPPLTSSGPLQILFTVGPPQLELEPLKLPSTAEPHESSTVSTQTLSSVEPPQSPLTLSTQTWSPPQLQLTGSGPLQIASSAEPPDVAAEQSLGHMTPTESSSSLSVKSWSTAELTHLQITVSGLSSTAESPKSTSGPQILQQVTTDEAALTVPGLLAALLVSKKLTDEDSDDVTDGEVSPDEHPGGCGGAPSSADDEKETYHFVKEPSRDYFCPILYELLLEPHLTQCCGQHFSERAVEQLKRRIRPCPMCAMPLVTIKDIHFRRKVRELPVFCPNKNKGCKWVAEVSAVKEHMEVCPWKFSSLRPDGEESGDICVPDNSIVVHTGTVFGTGLHGNVIEVAYRGSTIRAAKKYYCADRAALLKDFGQEKLLCSIRHANLVAYCGVGSLASDQSPVVLMEKMAMNLTTFLKKGSLSLDSKFKIVNEVLQGLSHLHSLKPAIIHGGLNENNVLISSREVAKITDFGNSFLATPILPSAAKRPLLEYMPPEVMRRDRCNEKVDIFSLGHLTLYIMNQQKPHLILGPTFEEQGKLIARSEVERRANHLEKMARQLDGGNTHPLSAIVTNCLSDDKDLRPSCKNILRSDFFTNPFDGNIQNAVVHPTGLTLGQGEYGKVLEVRYKTKTYAAKKYHLYPTHSSSLTPVMRMIKMRHPNILPYYGMCKLATDGSKVLVMRRIQINLTISLQRSMKLPKKVEVLNDVANGLHFLHNQTPAIIHRNLTANNVLLDVNGMARISDFADSSIVASLIHGTEDYMSPEALEGKEHNDRMDTFAFGHLSVYVIIQHRPVHLECSEHEVGGKVILRTEVERRKYHLDEMKSKLEGGADNPLYQLTISCLQDKPNSRPSSRDIVDTFSNITDDFVDFASISVHPTGVKLGEGAYGIVMEVECKGKVYAVKKYHRMTSDAISSFEREHKLLTQIKHRNIVSCFGLSSLATDKSKVIVMPKMKNNLTKFLDESPCIHLAQKNKILLDIAEGLHHLHSQMPAIIHRDLTTSNVLLDSNGTAKISDFGNSRLVDMAAYLTRIPGTLDYMPPEALEGGKYNDKLDIFSFAHLSIYVVIKHRPHPLLGSNYKNAVGELIARTEVDRRQHYLDKVKSTIGGGENHPLYGLIIRCLQIEPSARPSSEHVIAALIGINRRTPPASVKKPLKSNILQNMVAIGPINLKFITPRDVSAGNSIAAHSNPVLRCLHNTPMPLSMVSVASSATGSLQHSISGKIIPINASTPKLMRTSIPKNVVLITSINLAYITPKDVPAIIGGLKESLYPPKSVVQSTGVVLGRRKHGGLEESLHLPHTFVQPTGVVRGQRAYYSEYGGLEESLHLPHTIVHPTGVVLGQGAYGDVFEVRYKGKVYAAKKYRVNSTAPLAAFSREIEVLSRIRHPNIVPYYGICKLASDMSTVIVMERMDSNLNTFLRGEEISLKRKIHILNDITSGLHHLHRQTPAIIHRDLTAGNVLLDSNGTAKICDFGNSRLVDLHATPELMTSNPGTLDYMPPEALEGGEYNEKLDVFSFGHLSIHVLLQRRPHPLLRPTYKKAGRITPRTEVDRRQLYLKEMKSTLYGGDSHPLYHLVIQCVQDDPCERPSCADIHAVLLHI